MKLNAEKLRRQQEFVNKWILNNGKGTLEASTGFGKTYAGVLIIQEMLKRNPDRTTFIVVPTLELKSRWESEIKTHDLKNTTVSVINSAVKVNRVCSLLILDEIHNYASEVFGTIFQMVKYSFILGLTATMERSDKKHYYIQQFCPVIDTINLQESLAKNFISHFKVFNLEVELDEVERAQYDQMNKDFHKWFALFAHDFDKAMMCLNNPGYRAIFAKSLNWEEKTVYLFALNWMRNMQKRKKFLYFLPGKVTAAVEVIKAFNKKTITFSENTDFVDQLHKRTQDISVTYHSKVPAKIRKKNLELFEDPDSDIRIIHTAKALDEGFDVEGIEMAIICSGTSTIRQNVQRMGRSIRFAPGKTGIIINLYVPDTQDAKWLSKRQKTTPDENVWNVKSIPEIKGLLDEGQIKIDFTCPMESNDGE